MAVRVSAPNMKWEVVDGLFLVVYGAHTPTYEEWALYLKEVERQGVEGTLTLIATAGGGPDAVERNYLRDVLAGRAVPVAVLSDSKAIRGIVTALGWFNRKIRAFPSTGLSDALAYLEILPSRTKLIDSKLEELRLSVAVASATTQ